ncbi:MAG: DUF3471 domain-containing protein, partial [Terriglobus roseus]|nr:DUF3471 domain-containing protein [Terriglobus roseus]
ERFAGTYRLAPTFAITFSVEGGKLVGQATGQPKIALAYEGMKQRHPWFFAKTVNAEVEFVPDAGGKIASMVLHQGGRETPGVRQ